jgi:hypothetical protein
MSGVSFVFSTFKRKELNVTTANPVAAGGATSHRLPGLVLLLLGSVFGVFFLACLLLQVDTNVATLSGTHIDALYIDWSLPHSAWEAIFTRDLSQGEQGPIFGGWFIEVLYVGFSVVHEVMIDVLHKRTGVLQWLLSLGVWILIAFDIFADLISGPTFWVSSFFGHAAFVAILIVGVLGLGKLSIRLLTRGVQETMAGNILW